MSPSAGTGSGAGSFPQRYLRRIDLWLILLLGVGFALRWQYVHLPIAEAHSWRQITNADIARNFAEESGNLFYPQVSWGGPRDAYVSMEFPLLQWLAGMLFHVVRDRDLVCRLLSILFSMGTLVATFGLGNRLFDTPTGRAAAFLLAISPSTVFFGRTFISDTPMVFFSVAALWGLVTYAQTHDRRAAWWGIASATLACMVKIPAVLIFAPIAWLAWNDVRREATSGTWSSWLGAHVRALFNPVWVAAIAIPFVGTALWYWHGDRLFHRTGLGQAIFHPSGGYAPDVAMAMGPIMGVSHWSTFHQLADPEFYATLLNRTYYLHLTPAGFALALFGLVICWARPAASVVLVWLGAVLFFILASAEGNRYHEFHQLPMLPPVALLFGLAAYPAFDGAWLRRYTGSWLAPIASAICVTVVGLIGFSYSNVVHDYFRPDRLDLRSLSAGNAIEQRVPPGKTIIVVEYQQYGANSPILLYRAHRKGWSFDLSSITPHVVQRLQRQFGAGYFATTIWSHLEARHPDLAEYLKTQQQIHVDVPDTALFKLN
jgi:4-amino-4-deoxy-L-arabinose transferase-like glycosyltransferase